VDNIYIRFSRAGGPVATLAAFKGNVVGGADSVRDRGVAGDAG
jgi:hypothetical protein